MKPRIGFSLLIFLSAYAPLALLFGIRDVDTSLGAPWLKHPYFVFACLAVALLSVALVLFAVSRVQGQFIITIKEAKHCSKDLIEYSVPYVISFFSVDFGKWQDVAALLIFMGLLFLLALKTQTLFINPILAICGYQLYEVEFEESGKMKSGVFLSKGELNRQGICAMARVNHFLYLVTNSYPTTTQANENPIRENVA